MDLSLGPAYQKLQAVVLHSPSPKKSQGNLRGKMMATIFLIEYVPKLTLEVSSLAEMNDSSFHKYENRDRSRTCFVINV